MIASKFKLDDQVSNTYEHFKLVNLIEQGRNRYESHSNTARHGNMTPAIQAQRVKRRIRVASPGGQDSFPLDEGVQSLSLNTAEG